MAEPTIAQKAPYSAPVEAGKTYYWCACGKSANQPFCDGSHKGSEFAPLPYAAEKDGTAWFCGCKATKNSPMCDGSHKSLSYPSSPPRARRQRVVGQRRPIRRIGRATPVSASQRRRAAASTSSPITTSAVSRAPAGHAASRSGGANTCCAPWISHGRSGASEVATNPLTRNSLRPRKLAEQREKPRESGRRDRRSPRGTPAPARRHAPRAGCSSPAGAASPAKGRGVERSRLARSPAAGASSASARAAASAGARSVLETRDAVGDRDLPPRLAVPLQRVEAVHRVHQRRHIGEPHAARRAWSSANRACSIGPGSARPEVSTTMRAKAARRA